MPPLETQATTSDKGDGESEELHHHSGTTSTDIPWTFRGHSVDMAWTGRGHSVDIPWTFRGQTVDIP